MWGGNDVLREPSEKLEVGWSISRGLRWRVERLAEDGAFLVYIYRL